MPTTTILEELKDLYKAMTGEECTATNTADAIELITSVYSSGGSGTSVNIVSGELYADSSNEIKSGAITLSNGNIIPLNIVQIPKLTLSSEAGTQTNYTKITVAEKLEKSHSYRYEVDRSPAAPAKGENVSNMTYWDGKSEIEMYGSVLTIVEVDANNIAHKAGTIEATIAF